MERYTFTLALLFNNTTNFTKVIIQKGRQKAFSVLLLLIVLSLSIFSANSQVCPLTTLPGLSNSVVAGLPQATRCGVGSVTFTATGINNNKFYLLSTTSPTPGTPLEYNLNDNTTINPGLPIFQTDFTTSSSAEYLVSGNINNGFGVIGTVFPLAPSVGQFRIFYEAPGNTQNLFQYTKSVAGTEAGFLRAYTNPSTNIAKISWYNLPLTSTAYVKFAVTLKNTSNNVGNWYFALGNGSIFSDNLSPASFNDNNFFLNLEWQLNPNLSVNTNFINGSTQVGVLNQGGGQPFTQSPQHIVEIYCNNKNSDIIFARGGVEYVLEPGEYMVWVDNQRVYHGAQQYDFAKNDNFNLGTNLSALLFYSNANIDSYIEIDDLVFQPDIESQTIIAQAIGSPANLTTPILPVGTYFYQVGQADFTSTPPTFCVSPYALVRAKVNSIPTPTINAPLSACQNQAISVSTPDVSNYITWNFGVNATPTSASTSSASVSWSTVGTEIITLTVIDLEGCIGISSQLININATPTVSLTASSATVCTKTNVTITPTVGNATPTDMYSWDCDNCLSSPAGAGPQVLSWASIGTKTVTLQVKNSAGCISTVASVTVNVVPPPISTFSVSNNPICQNQTLTVTAIAGANYSWDCDGCVQQSIISNTTNNAPQLTWTTSGTKTVKLIVFQNGCFSLQSSVEVTVNPTPVASISGPSSGCLNTNYTFTAPPGLASYTWNFAGGGQAVVSGLNTNTLVVSWASTGAKSVTLQVVNNSGCVSSVVTQAITINNNPPLPTLTPPSTICGTGVNVTFTGIAIGAPPAALSWNFGSDATPTTFNTPAGVLITISNPVVQWSTIGAKTVTLTAINTSGCTSVVTAVVTVNALPALPVINAPSMVCVNQVVNISTSTSANVYAWNFGANATPATSSSAATNVSWSTSGGRNITLTITAANGCQATNTVVINVKPVPNVTLSANFSSVCVNANSTVSVTATGL
ncbi:MAG: hypothetical protein NZ576_06860, partial [Bacteroidia bacterium]|nr:hypothetical protein [Bacteroidia bacterium]